MRTPQDLPASAPKPHLRHRGRWWILGIVVVLIVVLLSLKTLATLYTDSLWFSSVDLHRVWTTLVGVKIGLFASFGAIFFVVLWANLLVCERLVSPTHLMSSEDELVRRYQHTFRPHSGKVYVAVSFLLALIAASGAVGEWNNWILFTHGGSFGVKDPEFHMDVGFFVFKLPFLEFLVNWTLIVLVVVLLVTAGFHYLNGGIRLQKASPRVLPSVKVHLSVILALIAVVKAAGYYLQRFQLDTSTNGYVEGAGYTDIHARLPALELLTIVSLFAAGILLYNIRRQGWTLPVLAFGIWAFVALAIGVIYPAVLEALKVDPAQSTLERPYIKRNIEATRAAYGLDHVKVTDFEGSTKLSAAEVESDATTLANVRLWDPNSSIALPTFQKLQDLKAYYTFQGVAVDRYRVHGKLRPVIIGVRQMNSNDLPASGWVNTHLVYTHGEGVALAQANETTSNGNPVFTVDDVPPSSSTGFPKITQPAVYFGLNDSGYVVADTKQPELDYQSGSTNHYSHYAGTGGVEMSSLLTRAAFAIREGNLNLLISNLITPHSKMMFVRTVVGMAEKAAPFLSFDSDPYPAVVNGHVDWIINAYTTTANYPYSQNADTEQVPPGSGLPTSYNYVRNSVVVVVNAYSGAMTFYAMDNDPILRAYESAFPGMFVPHQKMGAELEDHLRYPENLFSIQAAVYGRYHIVTPSEFYTASNSWSLSPTAGAGSPTDALAVTVTTNAQGQVTGGSLQRMAPLYQVMEEPGETTQSFTISDAYIPAAQGSDIQNLSAFIVANSDPGTYGTLHVYETVSGRNVVGPALADSYIEQNTTVSKEISLLDQHGSQVLLGNVLMVPVGQAMLYVRPLYTESTGNPQPQLKEVIVVFGQQVGMKPTLAAALNTVLNTKLGTAATVVTPGRKNTHTTVQAALVEQADNDLAQAASDYNQAQKDLKAGTLGGYQSEVAAAAKENAAAKTLLKDATKTTTPAPSPAPVRPEPTGTSSTTTTTTPPGDHDRKKDSTSSTTTTTVPPNEA